MPDVIDDEWLDDEEKLGERLCKYSEKRKRVNSFDLWCAGDVTLKGQRLELC